MSNENRGTETQTAQTKAGVVGIATTIEIIANRVDTQVNLLATRINEIKNHLDDLGGAEPENETDLNTPEMPGALGHVLSLLDSMDYQLDRLLKEVNRLERV